MTGVLRVPAFLADHPGVVIRYPPTQVVAGRDSHRGGIFFSALLHGLTSPKPLGWTVVGNTALEFASSVPRAYLSVLAQV